MKELKPYKVIAGTGNLLPGDIVWKASDNIYAERDGNSVYIGVDDDLSKLKVAPYHKAVIIKANGIQILCDRSECEAALLR